MTTPLRVVLVGGNLEISDTIRRVVSQACPVRMVEVDNADDLAVFLRFGKLDVVLCNDRGSGFSTADALHVWTAAGAPVPFVLIGRDGARSLMAACATPGAVGYLVRGFADLPAALSEVLAAGAVAAAPEGGERRVRDVLDETHRVTDQFLSAFSHELRTPLSTILGHADLLSDAIGPLLDDDAKRSLDAVMRGGLRLANLINDTLDLARLRTGMLRPEVRRFDAGHLVADVVESFAPAIAAKGLTVATSIPPQALPVSTDAHRLRQILGYLIDNAIKFTPRGGINVAVQGQQGQLLIEVRDTGIGINATDLRAVFDDFRQVDGSSTRSYDGCGLGLAVGWRLARMMGGTIEVESKPSLGSSFRVIVPRHIGGRSDVQR